MEKKLARKQEQTVDGHNETLGSGSIMNLVGLLVICMQKGIDPNAKVLAAASTLDRV